MQQKVVFGSSVEALWRALEPFTEAETKAFAALGVRDGRRFDAAYPLVPYMAVLTAAAKGRFSHLEGDAAYVQVGHLYIQGFTRTFVGQALAAMLRIIGPRRTLERMTRNLRSANNYTETQLETLAPNHHLLRINEVAFPGFYQGVLEATCTNAGAKQLSVRCASYEAGALTLELRWA